jgi:multisubunit Na+/H+ antiporter MnhG subunit
MAAHWSSAILLGFTFLLAPLDSFAAGCFVGTTVVFLFSPVLARFVGRSSAPSGADRALLRRVTLSEVDIPKA